MRILIVEDDERLADVLRRALNEAGFAADVATDAETAQWTIEATEYDGVVLDVGLPGRSGIELCRELRDKGNHVPILMLTARIEVSERVEGLDAGADDYLTKPFDIDELLARVRALVRRGPAASAPQMRVADLTLDATTHIVSRAGSVIDLSGKEFAILELLMSRPGHAVSRFDIYEHVWEYDAEHGSNVINVYIKNLRKKVDRPFASPLIETVRGVGYRISGDD
ncbi:MAG: two component transcriptional regulator, winged helix family [Thermoleophilia bacterium]|nr:two component transcriptional regulator, winged helix family [Thermoleophilia bacterium]